MHGVALMGNETLRALGGDSSGEERRQGFISKSCGRDRSGTDVSFTDAVAEQFVEQEAVKAQQVTLRGPLLLELSEDAAARPRNLLK